MHTSHITIPVTHKFTVGDIIVRIGDDCEYEVISVTQSGIAPILIYTLARTANHPGVRFGRAAVGSAERLDCNCGQVDRQYKLAEPFELSTVSFTIRHQGCLSVELFDAIRSALDKFDYVTEGSIKFERES